jgi:hypothetical protein
MVEVFLTAGPTAAELTMMLRAAVDHHREDIVELLLKKGGDARSVPFSEVLHAGNPGIARLFVQFGADFRIGSPFAEAFRSHRRGVLGVFRTLVEKHPDIIVQANEALVSVVQDRSPRWIALLLWLGADLRARVKHPKWDDETVSGLEEAAKNGLVDVLRKAKLDPKIDDCVGLVELVGISPDATTLEYLISFDPDLSRSSAPSASVMDWYISALCWSLDPTLSVGRPEKAIECIKLLAKYGVQWDPIDRGKSSHLRSNLTRINAWHALGALASLLKANVFGEGVLIN